jgi:hypothetical protein
MRGLEAERASLSWLVGAGGVSHAAEAVNVVAETDIDIARILVVAVARAAVLVTEFPRAAPNDSGLAGRRPAGVLLGRLLVVVHLVEIVAPLPDVTDHVVQSPWIGGLLAYGPRMPARVLIEPGVVGQL